ncbi:MAG TPA: ATP-binding protein [Rubricoccaceae bacterium]
MTTARHLLALWGRYVALTPLEREPAFRPVLDEATDRGLRVAGLFGVASLIGAVTTTVVAALLAGEGVGTDTVSEVLSDKLFLLGSAVLFLLVRRFRPSLRVARALLVVYIAVVGVMLVTEDLLRGDIDFTAAWLTLLLMLSAGTVPLRPVQTLAVGAGLTVLHTIAITATTSSGELIGGGVVRRIVFLILFTVVCTMIGGALYAGRVAQHRSTVRMARLRDRLQRRSEDLELHSAAMEVQRAELAASVDRLSKAQTQLVQQEKMVSLGQLTAGVAHELKNPLNFVNNFAQLSEELLDDLDAELREDPSRPVGEALDASGDLLTDLRANASKIREHGRRADGIIRSMLAHSRSTPGPRRPAKLNTLLDEYVGLAYHGMRAEHAGFNVDLVRDYDPLVGEVEMVPEEMGRVFLNLLDNAFAAVREREVAAGPASSGGAPFAPRVVVQTRQVPDGVAVAVTDNGTGMSEEVRERIFEPFFTTKPTGEGTGLGLSLTYEIVVHGHGGTLALDTEEGVGTTFTVTLPPKQPAQSGTGTLAEDGGVTAEAHAG